jgi:hypothetical protein
MYVCMYVCNILLQNYNELRLHVRGRGVYDYREYMNGTWRAQSACSMEQNKLRNLKQTVRFSMQRAHIKMGMLKNR